VQSGSDLQLDFGYLDDCDETKVYCKGPDAEEVGFAAVCRLKTPRWEELGGEVLFSAVVLNRQGALFSTTEKNGGGGRKEGLRAVGGRQTGR
jgi:hypothetical protein